MNETLFFVVFYVLGSISPGWLMVKTLTGSDMRTVGSGGTGATNVYRIAGIVPAVVVFVLDVLKGMAPILILRSLGYPVWFQMVGGCAVLIGHTFPVFLRFKGGKAVASGLGFVLTLNPYLALMGLGVFLIGFLPTGIVAVGSVLAALAVMPLSLVYHDYLLTGTMVAVGILIIVLHKKNIKRIIAGTEKPLFSWRKVVAYLLAPLAMRSRATKHAIFSTHLVGESAADIKKCAEARFPWAVFVPQRLVAAAVPYMPKWTWFTGVSIGLRSSKGTPLAVWTCGIPRLTEAFTDTKHPQYDESFEMLIEGISQTAALLPAHVRREEVVVGLGAATGITGRNGHQTRLRLADAGLTRVTNGNTLTAVMVVETLERVRKVLKFETFLGCKPKVGVIGARGSVGSKCCQLLLRLYGTIYIVGRDTESLKPFREKLLKKAGPGKEVIILSSKEDAYRICDITISTTNEAAAESIDESVFKSGHVVIDVGEPANLPQVKRRDVLVLKGGLAIAPGPFWAPGFGKMIGLPTKLGIWSRMGYACAIETVLHTTGTTKMWDPATPPDAYVGSTTLELMDDLLECFYAQGFKTARLHTNDNRMVSRLRRLEYLRRRTAVASNVIQLFKRT